MEKHKPKVYLAGPISGLTYAQGQSWRDYAKQELRMRGIEAFSPLRAKEYLKDQGVLEQSYLLKDQPVSCLSTDRGITVRDRWDVQTSDAVMFNLLGAERISIGTCIEYGWADANRKLIVTVMEKSGNSHDYPMIREISGFRVETLELGIEVLGRLLNS